MEQLRFLYKTHKYSNEVDSMRVYWLTRIERMPKYQQKSSIAEISNQASFNFQKARGTSRKVRNIDADIVVRMWIKPGRSGYCWAQPG